MDTDKSPRLGNKYQVEALPTLILFNKVFIHIFSEKFFIHCMLLIQSKVKYYQNETLSVTRHVN